MGTPFVYEAQARAAVRDILAEAESLFDGVSAAQIISADRHRHIVEARHWVCRKAMDKGISCTTIGRVLRRDHTTILDGAARDRARQAALTASREGQGI